MSRRLHMPEVIRVQLDDLLAWKCPSCQLASADSLPPGRVAWILGSFELIPSPNHLCRVHQFSVAIDDGRHCELALLVASMKRDFACPRWCSADTVKR